MGKKNTRPAPNESALYAPVRDYLAAQGYTVRGEVGGCDLAAEKDGELILVELKVRINLELLLQAAQRQRVADSVYVAVPRPGGAGCGKRWRQLTHLLRRLELGLLLVSLEGGPEDVQVAFHPVPFERKRHSARKRAVLKEMAGRSGDWNTGGVRQTKLVTAYREQAIFIACCLERHGPQSPKALRALGASEKTQAILYGNVYGWFERIEKGVYGLTAKGQAALKEYPVLTKRFRVELDRHKKRRDG